MMVQHRCNDGFTLVEMCVVLLMLAVFDVFFLPHPILETEWVSWPCSYMEKQAEALAEAEDTSGPEGTDVLFNGRGNVRRAGTVRIGKKVFTISLGQGRLLEK